MNTLQFNGGMLTGSEIMNYIKSGLIEIDPYSEERINPNSYNLRLDPHLLIYTRGNHRSYLDPMSKEQLENSYPYAVDFINHSFDNQKKSILEPLDIKKNNPTREIIIPEHGYILYPGVLYIGRTVEKTSSDYFIPMISGRSSGGRLGISVHVCAGFGDIGFNGTWTLEITVVEPLIIYPNIEIAQICWFTPIGDTNILYKGKYNNQEDATASRMYMDRSV